MITKSDRVRVYSMFSDQQHPESGLNGGTFWDRSRQNEQQFANDPKAEYAPKCIRLKQKNGRDYQDEMIVMRVSNDGVLGGVYVQSNEILIYRFINSQGELIPEKQSSRAIETHKVNIGQFRKMLDLYIFKKPNSGASTEPEDYQMYVLFEEGILLYNNIDRRTEPQLVHDSQNEGLYLSPSLSDCRNGILMVDVVQRLPNN